MSDSAIDENAQSDYSTVAMRLRDVEECKDCYGTREIELMLSAVRLVRANAWRVPMPIQADLEIRLYRMFKSIADQVADFQDTFRPMLRE